MKIIPIQAGNVDQMVLPHFMRPMVFVTHCIPVNYTSIVEVWSCYMELFMGIHVSKVASLGVKLDSKLSRANM